MDQVGIEMRPDKCGVIFEKLTNSVMAGVTGGYIAPIVRGQIEAFNREGISVVIFNHSNKQKKHYLADAHTIGFVEAEIDDSA
jgi:hypothetical protein